MAKKSLEPKTKKRDEVAEPKKLTIPSPQLDRLLRFEMETRAFSATKFIAEQQRTLLLAKLDPTGKLAQFDSEVQKQEELRRRAREKFLAVAHEIEAQMGIDLSDYEIDDSTGELKKIELPTS